MYLGMSAAEAPFVASSKLFTALYFMYFLAVLPTLNWLTRQLVVRAISSTSLAASRAPDTVVRDQYPQHS